MKKLRMNGKEVIKTSLTNAISTLDKLLFDKPSEKYKVRISSFPIRELIAVHRINNIKIEVRSKEGPHNTPHFHISVKGQGEGSYRIEDMTTIHSCIEPKIERKIIAWAEEHRQLLVDTWNKFHGYRVTVK